MYRIGHYLLPKVVHLYKEIGAGLHVDFTNSASVLSALSECHRLEDPTSDPVEANDQSTVFLKTRNGVYRNELPKCRIMQR